MRISKIHSLFFVLTALTLSHAPLSYAEDGQPKHVVELFTSQGCSSCPPANSFVGKVADMPGALVLSYGVTYWDYLGWKDTFATPEFTKRQKDYGKALGSANVYTPQIILNGTAHGSRYSKWDVSTMELPEERPVLKSHVEDQGFTVSVKPSVRAVYEAVLVEYVEGPQSVPVSAGENHGRVLTLTNVVTDLHPLGRWNTEDNPVLKPSVALRNGKSYALILTDPETMRIKAATTFQP